ncbi:MipA/OmpV family protein [Sphingomonas gilva]|uniref:MipA/OmpV family protein n=2 Tax=Sphingomonas gilva TaxID=2305907 RepID=A0A396RQA9_9SPHN|nr:MipA/OmpV family protein [Sphingomonas gilva]
MIHRTLTALFAAALLATPALAQDTEQGQTGQADPGTAVDNPSLDPDRDTVTAGVGVVVIPDYEGSNDYRVIPGAIVRGKVSGISFFTRGLALFVDVIPEPPGESVDISFGPMIQYRGGRSSLDSIEDPRIRALGETDSALEVGAWAGVSKTGIITSAYDTLGARISYQHDVIGGHDSYVITPTIEYGTPLSTTTFVGLGVTADYVGDDFARTYFSIAPGQSVASGLPAYDADGGFKSVGGTLILGQSLSGDLRHGLGLFGLIGYNRLLGDFADSPIVSVAGSRNQWFGGIGLGYTF